MNSEATHSAKVAVVLPCHRVKAQILGVLEKIGPEVTHIYVVDDCCPDGSGRHVQENCADPRVSVIVLKKNLGVGGAMIKGFSRAIQDGCHVVVKVDGDGQMDPVLIPAFIAPLLSNRADYTKGNRFFALESLRAMPVVRLFGNAALSFITKASSGYWNLMDPTNGYVAVRGEVLSMLPLGKIDCGYFFESDMLFRLNTIRAVVKEIPMDAVYEDEQSSLNIRRVLLEFPLKHLNRFFKRIFYNYFLRDFNLCSLQLVLGVALFFGGTIFGLYHWIDSMARGVATPIGTVMLAALPIILGFQALMSAANFDVMNVPAEPIHRSLSSSKGRS